MMSAQPASLNSATSSMYLSFFFCKSAFIHPSHGHRDWGLLTGPLFVHSLLLYCRYFIMGYVLCDIMSKEFKHHNSTNTLYHYLHIHRSWDSWKTNWKSKDKRFTNYLIKNDGALVSPKGSQIHRFSMIFIVRGYIAWNVPFLSVLNLNLLGGHFKGQELGIWSLSIRARKEAWHSNQLD